MIPIISIISAPILFVIIYQFTPAMNAFIIKQLFEAKPFASPKDIETTKQQVVVKKDIVYGREIDNSLLDIYYPKNIDKNLPVIMWIHGGGFVSGSKEQTQEYGMSLAQAGYVVANINYAIAPAQKYPGPIIQANQALKYLQDNIAQYGGDINRLFIGGDSAGAQMASQTVAVISNKKLAKAMDINPYINKKQVKGVILFCGVYNMDRIVNKVYDSQSSALSKILLQTLVWSYTGVKDFSSIPKLDEMSIVKQVTSDFPPVFLTVGDADPLAPHSTDLIEVLKKNNVEVESVLFDGTKSELGHEYQFDFTSSHAEKTLGKTIEFLNKH
ncbi:alpha/beta hydrolase [Brevibacillus laterosporus]|uniref:Alpha/beta hydrolase n=1 Tax=Brevibacillus laterosporus TaxID=1465 RepID=A0A502INB1_BRELA|nr:alpha/beta hydrolase [Brevibacillus laterosporus]QDX95761.1 alpha/beta hydrolase [Brevibacillus laterosporus]TPG73491.1 alpha/beta hydrolase [Brevibacillus laterosporus]TPG86966.1 alpha/beta hydrolase [Brevibacillus laterosporus]